MTERGGLTMAERTVRTGRRIGNWRYVEDRWMGDRWRLSGTTIDLQYDPLDGGGSLRGAWRVFVGDDMHEAIDHFLDGAMDWVERVIGGTVIPVSGIPSWIPRARGELAGESAS